MRSLLDIPRHTVTIIVGGAKLVDQLLPRSMRRCDGSDEIVVNTMDGGLPVGSTSRMARPDRFSRTGMTI